MIGGRDKNSAFVCSIFLFFFLFPPSILNAQETDSLGTQEKETIIEKQMPDQGILEEGVPSREEESSQELVRLAWDASHKNNLEELMNIVDRCVALYGNEALLQQAQLDNFPPRGEETNYQSLNDVGTCLFIKAEALMNIGRMGEAIAQFQDTITNYRLAQAWDPRGWYWSIAEKSQDSIDVLTGKAEDQMEKTFKRSARTVPKLHDRGIQGVIDYTKYGKFLNVGKEKYKYSLGDIEGLQAAVGEGIYPNTASVYNNPAYKRLKNDGRLEGNHWDFVNSDDLEAAYFKWATAREPWGVRLFYLGMIFEKAGMLYEALKAYHAIVVHFPKTNAMTYWQTPWYPGQAAIAKIKHILRIHPELNLKEKWMKIEVYNGFDNDTKNDVIVTYPGKIVRKSFIDKIRERFHLWETNPLKRIVKTIGEGDVQLVQYENGHWQLLVNNKPYVIKGTTYTPTKVGQSPDKGTVENWMTADLNKNGKIDGPFDAWVDINRNNIQDGDEKVIGDFQLMKDMGVNTLRIYHHPNEPNKALLMQMYEDYGIRVIMGDFLGKYTLGSGATWLEGTDYENPEHRKNMLDSVKKMVMEFKDEPYILMWIIGNENNYGVASNADKKPKVFFEFVNEVALWIKTVDKNHPVSVGNGDTLFLDIFAEYAPDVDIYAANVYRGDYGFGSFWEQVFDASGKPAYISEFGCPAFAQHLTREEAEKAQADYLKGNWLDIEENLAGHARGVGNALGGVVFEWLDEWWKSYEPFRHDRKSDAIGPFPGGYYYEEWFGLISQGNGSHSPFLRQLRESYHVYKDLWKQ